MKTHNFFVFIDILNSNSEEIWLLNEKQIIIRNKDVSLLTTIDYIK